MEAARPATRDDLPVIVEIARHAIAAQDEVRGGPLWQRREARAEPLEEAYAQAIADDEHRVVVGTLDDVVVGFAVAVAESLRSGEQLAVVSDLWVDPEARGVGVGEAIMDDLVAWASQRGCLGIDALALPGDRATKNFFERFGLVARAIVVHRPLETDR